MSCCFFIYRQFYLHSKSYLNCATLLTYQLGTIAPTMIKSVFSWTDFIFDERF